MGFFFFDIKNILFQNQATTHIKKHQEGVIRTRPIQLFITMAWLWQLVVCAEQKHE